MNTIESKGNWHEMKGKLKKKFAVLTDNDQLYIEGREEELYGSLHKKIEKTEVDLRKLMKEI
ncbi:MAG: CsbD family protein [Prolixibacteraceae bacterium]|nr:CsbD family protein [Prolixibacteraceae bacterium]